MVIVYLNKNHHQRSCVLINEKLRIKIKVETLDQINQIVDFGTIKWCNKKINCDIRIIALLFIQYLLLKR